MMRNQTARLIALTCAGLVASACGKAGQTPPSQAEPPAPPPPAASSPATAPPIGQAAPAGEGAPRYVGRWAAASTACGHEAWRFTAGGLQTPGEVACTFDKVTPVAGGYDVAMQCVAEAPSAPSTLHLRFAQSAKGMLVSGGPFTGEVGLLYCGR